MTSRKYWTRLLGFLAVVAASLVAVIVTDTKPELGLDLQGGISVVLQAKGNPSESKLNTAVDRIRSRIDSLGVAEPEIQRLGSSIVVDLPGAKNRDQALDLAKRSGVLQIRPVLQSGPYADPNASTTKSTSTSKRSSSSSSTAAESTTTTTTTTTTTSATAGPAGQSLRSGAMPQVDPSTTTTSTPTSSTTSVTDSSSSSAVTASSSAAVQTSTTSDAATQQLTTPEQVEANTTSDVLVLGTDKTTAYQLGPVAIPGEQVSSAEAQIDQTGRWVIQLTFSDKGLAAFNAMAADQYAGKNRGSAFVLDGEVLSAPTFESQTFTDNDIVISNNSSPDGLGETEATSVAKLIDEGRLPVVFEASRVEDVSPTLGKDQLRAGIIAGLVGLGIVALYMLVIYRLLGLVVWCGIALSGAALYVLVSFLGSVQGLTLTLAGVTGVIVSIGVTVDSYVVFFERLKDEMRQGRTLRSSLDSGFRKAFRTIVAADLVSILGALVIYQLSIGSVRGFAYFLAISVLLDLAVAYFFMYPAVALLARRKSLATGTRFGMAASIGVSAPTGGQS